MSDELPVEISDNIPKEIKDIFAKFHEHNLEIYLVGGAVRDLLMGKVVTDWDFTTNATPPQIQELFPESFYNNQFGTVGIDPIDPDFKPHEITTYRSERGYSDNRRPDEVTWGSSLEEDLQRRDFTINALALKLESGSLELIDLHNGQADLNNKIVRTVGKAAARFDEDALRMMRAIRFAAQLNFQIETETLDAIRKYAERVNTIAVERVRDELMKIVASDHPYEGVLLMKEAGLVDVVLPELIECFGVEQKSPGRHHIYDVGTHSLMSLKYCKSQDPLVRFATLIHDIGKPQTYAERDGIITFYNHEVVGSRIANNIANRLRFSKRDKDRLFKLVRWHQFTVDENQTDSAIRRFIKKVGKENVDDMLDLRTGDRLGGGARETSWRLEEYKTRLVEVQKQPFSVADLKVDGADVMKVIGIEPGPRVGEILKDIFKKVEEKELPNEKDVLLKKLNDYIKD